MRKALNNNKNNHSMKLATKNHFGYNFSYTKKPLDKRGVSEENCAQDRT